MKNVLIFVAGMVAALFLRGIITASLELSELSEVPESYDAPALDSGITLFDAPAGSLSEYNFEVREVLDSGDAIAEEICRDYLNHNNITVVFYRQEGVHYFDDQTIKVPAGKCVRHIGMYDDDYQTLPVVEISDK